MSNVCKGGVRSFVKTIGSRRMAHIGEILRQGINRSGKSIVEVAGLVGKSRQTIHSWMEMPAFNQQTLKEIGEKIDYDFRVLLGDNADPGIFEPFEVSEPMVRYAPPPPSLSVMVAIEAINITRIPANFQEKINEMLRNGKFE
ncbi:MAG: hypothetical protein ACPG5O_04085 [Pseudoalteromonas tetraodonis]